MRLASCSSVEYPSLCGRWPVAAMVMGMGGGSWAKWWREYFGEYLRGCQLVDLSTPSPCGSPWAVGSGGGERLKKKKNNKS